MDEQIGDDTRLQVPQRAIFEHLRVQELVNNDLTKFVLVTCERITYMQIVCLA